jgi:hypothetical protein
MKTGAERVHAQTPAHGAGGVGQRAKRGVDIGVGEHSRAQALAGDGFVSVEREVGDHLNAAPSQGRRKRLHQTHDLRIGSK